MMRNNEDILNTIVRRRKLGTLFLVLTSIPMFIVSGLIGYYIAKDNFEVKIIFYKFTLIKYSLIFFKIGLIFYALQIRKNLKSGYSGIQKIDKEKISGRLKINLVIIIILILSIIRT